MFIDGKCLTYARAAAAIAAARDRDAEERQEQLLDQALEDTFPASDPIGASWIG